MDFGKLPNIDEVDFSLPVDSAANKNILHRKPAIFPPVLQMNPQIQEI
jgi:hypothetical protein